MQDLWCTSESQSELKYNPSATWAQIETTSILWFNGIRTDMDQAFNHGVWHKATSVRGYSHNKIAETKHMAVIRQDGPRVSLEQCSEVLPSQQLTACSGQKNLINLQLRLRPRPLTDKNSHTYCVQSYMWLTTRLPWINYTSIVNCYWDLISEWPWSEHRMQYKIATSKHTTNLNTCQYNQDWTSSWD